MKYLKGFFTLVVIVTLLFARVLAFDGWFGSVSLFGLFLTFVDYYTKIGEANSGIKKNSQLRRFAIIQLPILLMSCVLLVILVWNILSAIKWVSDPLFLDVTALLGLLLSLSQDLYIEWINAYIQGDTNT